MSKNTKMDQIALWNPVWTVVWSFIFSPAFGSMLQKTNWTEMGEYDKASTSGLWFSLSLFFLAAYLFAEPFIPEDIPLVDYLFFICWVVFYLIWILCNGLGQIRYVRERYGTGYYHRLWTRPILIGVGGLVLWIAVSLTYIICLIMSGVLVIGDKPL